MIYTSARAERRLAEKRKRRAERAEHQKNFRPQEPRFARWTNPADPKDVRVVQSNAELGVAPVRLSNGTYRIPASA